MTNQNVTNESSKIQPKKEIQYSPLRLVGILTVIAFCTILLIVATFTRIKVINCLHPIEAMLHPSLFPDFQSLFAIKAYFYAPQVPLVLFAVALLGAACSMTSVFFYIVLGLAFIPIFGLGGGGFQYVLEPTFGYILAFIPATLIAGAMLEKDHSYKNMLKASLAAVLTIHILGFFYMLLVSLIRHEQFSYIMDWLLFESLIKTIYDFIFGFICMVIAKFCRKFIWILTAT